MNLDLRQTAGFSLSYDNQTLSSSDLSLECTLEASISDISQQLINSDLSFPHEFYSIYSATNFEQVLGKKSIHLNIFVIYPGLAGIEYIKTRASIVYGYNRLVEVVNGSGFILLQKYINNTLEDVVLARLRVNEKIVIPSNYYAIFINTKSLPLVISELSSSKATSEFGLDDMGGLAYYVISKNSKSEQVRNPRYKSEIKLRKIDWAKLNTHLFISPKTPIIKQILRKYDKFSWLFNKNSEIML